LGRKALKVKASAVISIVLPSHVESTLIYESIKPETESAPTSRSKVEITKEGKKITFLFEASDTTALRAAVNSYLRWVMLIVHTLNKLKELTKKE